MEVSAPSGINNPTVSRMIKRQTLPAAFRKADLLARTHLGNFAMAIVQTGVFTLYERFPDQKKKIRALHESSETFKTLCEDHRKCRDAIRYWERKEGNVAFEHRQEYGQWE